MNEVDPSQLELIGLNAYRSGDFDQAAAALKALIVKDPKKWSCKLYLGMSYTQLGRISSAIQEFRDISEWCPDKDLREKATVALRAMNKMSHGKIEPLPKRS